MTAAHTTTVRVSNLLPFCRQVQEELHKLSMQPSIENTNGFDEYSIRPILEKIRRKVKRLKNALKKKGIPPARLPLPSYRAYLWLNFLGEEAQLRQHLVAMREYQSIAQEVLQNPAGIGRLLNPVLEINIFCLPYIYQTKKQGGKTQLSIHEALINAPRKVKIDLALAALKGSKPALRDIRKYCSSREYYQMENLIRGNQQAQGSSPRGKQVDLGQVFEKVNREYFRGQLEQPQLSWSVKRSYRRLGTYSAQLDQVTVSRTLDNMVIPSYVIEYIMFHELLHKKVGVQRANSGKRNHTKAFKELEKQFEYYEEANQYLKTLAPKARRGIFRSQLR